MKKAVLLLLLFPILSVAQSLKGIVFSKNDNLPLADVNVRSLSNNANSLTNKKGEYILKAASNLKDNDSIEFSHVGFTSLKLSLNDLKLQQYNVVLSDEMENLSELTISSNRGLKLKSNIAYTKLSPLKSSISSFGSLLHDGKIYVVGGDASFGSDALQRVLSKQEMYEVGGVNFLQSYLNELRRQFSLQLHKGDFLIYDIKTNTWQVSETKFIKRAFNHLLYYDNALYVLGGKRLAGNKEFLENRIEVFDLNKNEIVIDKTNPHQAINFASFLYKDNIIVLGGAVKSTEKGQKVFTNKTHFYNLTSGLWYELSDMPIAKETNGVLIGDKIYLIGGNNGEPLNTIQSLDLLTDKWQNEGELFFGMERPAVTSNNDIIYFFENRKIYCYNVVSKELKEYTIDLELKSAAMHFFNDTLYIVGGYTFTQYSNTPSANMYSISIDEFDSTKPNRIKTLVQKSDAN
ncbi:Kelch repeat-containing protein [Flavobacterium hercynium]|uniref:Galactose oxidase n=1 Tax=Flavobacterium hercynium TaxID=387094 RepID=A0A226GMZ5_9FLAO|nr:carboxypeptidase-like regulatory domain-containing protein [Flavobacterium hercynium]OXA83412.1 galactose oxidase [Flavobacterium hercynium]SMP36924.1 Kelch motif-containing protein [Flavobacterium hercynium]